MPLRTALDECDCHAGLVGRVLGKRPAQHRERLGRQCQALPSEWNRLRPLDAPTYGRLHPKAGLRTALRVAIDIRVVGSFGPGKSSVYASIVIAPGVVVA